MMQIPKYDPATHYIDLTNSDYYRSLLAFRSILKSIVHDFWKSKGSLDVDLYMLTSSISSPMGPGSDSEGIPIVFGDLATYLVDSSQFGFEPMILNDLDIVNCWLPSMRGEDPDKTHLNQFYHIESEIAGNIVDIKKLVEELLRYMCKKLLSETKLLNDLSRDLQTTKEKLKGIADISFNTISFDEAVSLLEKNGHGDCVKKTSDGRDITRQGELAICSILKLKLPIWIQGYDRDRVPFYQKPDPNNSNRVLNADLIAPPINKHSYGGEIAGCGQRQDNKKEILESINRQRIDITPYLWYADLRLLSNYRVTSGFGLGLERFIAWLLNIDDIKLVIPYPRLKGIKTLP